ncbi:GPI ethanolamine phosphate transferase 3-like [Clytia hemisphaerica]|uniref:GPI ethanolamine phosphate transferase 3 n=1 Tax=Clytia hemisphaerica TaxID=252671 RepID=A0A7M6DRL7_9CNID
MSIGCRIVLLILWVYVVFTCALLLFSKGFLLNRVVINNASECQTAHWMVNNLQKGIHSHIRIDETSQKRNVENKLKIKCGVELQPKFQKAILVIIDGLRYDFLTYNPDLDLKAVLPFENKMVKLYNLLSEQPANGKLFKFEADPPTTTMQRIKGITTGSLPTFVDAGTNFNSYEITEDNILSQTLKQNKNISFMGCSTWTELFPTHFHRKIPFSALNVRDLDTIDYGIMRNILQEVKRDDWSLLIAHFLGVDHCGHRYGTHHPEMTRKLTEMDKVIKDLTETMDEETILFVMGDHGMTRSGDHGGDSKDEVMAGLFVYSKKGLFQPTQDHLDLPKVSQIDLVPTLSLLLDQPIPFSNLGTIIPQFFQGPSKPYLPHYLKQSLPTNDATRELIARLFQQINAAHVSHLNTKQLFGFINEYQKVSTDLPFAKVEAARINFDFLDDKFEENLQELLNLDFTDPSKLQTRLKDLEELVLEFQTSMNYFKARS